MVTNLQLQASVSCTSRNSELRTCASCAFWNKVVEFKVGLEYVSVIIDTSTAKTVVK